MKRNREKAGEKTLPRIEHVREGYYEVQDVDLGKVYRWCPGCIQIECSCGRSSSFSLSATVCECGVDHTAIIEEGSASSRPKEDKAAHPWRYWRSSKEGGIPF